jgi:hypothetical protein
VHHASMQIINTHPPNKHENSIGEIRLDHVSICRARAESSLLDSCPSEVEKCTDVRIKSAVIKHILMHDLI